MPKECTIRLHPEVLNDPEKIRKKAARSLKIHPNQITHHEVIRRSIDARKVPIMYSLGLRVWIEEPVISEEEPEFPLQDVSNAQPAVIVGAGPAGLFAALQLIQAGLCPVIIERGKGVRERRRDLARITKEGIVNPDSNYCFGEGGAGTFSDGKLYTRSTKRGDTREVLETLVHFGATREILIDAHPHIGTNKLPAIIQQMRETIIECGGVFRFDTKLTGLNVQGGKVRSVVLNETETLATNTLILATGHSARDIFRLLHQEEIAIEAKPFALGLRVEHPQELIDQIQYHSEVKPEHLPAASYSLVHQVRQKGVYSFCMCPGGIICPAATANDEVVVNGWSPSMRNTGFANSGMVVEMEVTDYANGSDSPLVGVEYQSKVEQAAFKAGGGKQVAPALRLTDFVAGKISQDLPGVSYLPGIVPGDLNAILPKMISTRLREGFKFFGQRMRGYLSREAVVVGVESRTSSPVRIPRDQTTLMHPQVEGLFPCGEGAGYAGGIMSAAIDGKRCARALVAFVGQPS